MQSKIIAEGDRRIGILQEMGLLDKVADMWAEKTACFSKCVMTSGGMKASIVPFFEDEELNAIKEHIENEKSIKIYHAIYNTTFFGRIISFLAVSSYEEDWELESNDLKNGYVMAYCYNIDEKYGEFGTIGFRVTNGALVRTE